MNYVKLNLKLIVIVLIAVLISNTPAFSGVDYFLKISGSDVKKGKSNDEGVITLKNLSSGEYTLSLSKKSLRDFAGVSSTLPSASGIAKNEEGVPDANPSTPLTVEGKGIKIKNNQSTRGTRKSVSIIILDRAGNEVMRKTVTVGDLDGDGLLDIPFTLKDSNAKSSDSPSTMKWSLEVRVERIEMK